MATKIEKVNEDNLMNNHFMTSGFINAYIDTAFETPTMKIDIDKNEQFERLSELLPQSVKNWTDKEEKEHRTLVMKMSKYMKVFDEKQNELVNFDWKKANNKVFKFIFKIVPTKFNKQTYISPRITEIVIKDKPKFDYSISLFD